MSDASGGRCARLFLLVVAPRHGAYYLTFGSGWAGLADGPVDTVTMETVLQRRYDVPVLFSVEGGARFPSAPPPLPPAPRLPEPVMRRP